MKRILFSGLMAAALLSGCKKDTTDPATTGPSAKTTSLLNKRWGLTAATAQQGSLTQDAFAQLQSCQKDNYLRFNDDHSVEANEGVAKCDAADLQSRTGRWELVDNETKLLLTTPLFGTGGAVIPEIVELNATRMVLRGTIIDNGVTTTYTATLTPY
jgi:Lipocalin-like domain